jgi:hypothetical protein
MRGRVISVVMVAAFAVFVAALSDRSVALGPFGDPNAEPAPFNPQMAALMSMLIQPRQCQARACRQGGKLAARRIRAQGAQAELRGDLKSGPPVEGFSRSGPARRSHDPTDHAPRFCDQAPLQAPIR